MRRRVSFRTGLLWVMGVGLLGIVCAAGLALLGVQVSPVVTAALGLSSIWVPTALCWTAVYRVRLRRPEVLLAAAAVTSWTVGSTYYVGLQTTAGPVPFPSFADVGSALFYTLMAAALVVAVHRQARGLASSLWWDAAVGSLGAAAVLAVVLNPLLAPALTRTPSLTTLALAAYPLPTCCCSSLPSPGLPPCAMSAWTADGICWSQGCSSSPQPDSIPSRGSEAAPECTALTVPGGSGYGREIGLGVRRESAESAAGPKNPKPPQPGNP